MPISKALNIAAALSLFCASDTAAQNPPPGWKGKIVVENGLRTVLNPETSLFGTIDFEIEEDLRIGDDKDDRTAFYNLVRFALDSAGCVYIMDSGNSRIQKFDGAGNFLLSFGHKGQGPGEFQQLSDIFVDGRDHVLVYDNLGGFATLHEFDRKGIFIRSSKFHSPNTPGVRLEFIRPGIFLALGFSDLRGEGRQELFLLNLQGERLRTIVDYPLPPRPPRIKNHSLGNPYEALLWRGGFRSGGGIYGHSSAYQLFVLDAEGNTTAVIKKDAPSVSVTNKDKERLIEGYLQRQEKRSIGEKLTRDEVRRAYIFPKTAPFFSRIFMDDRDGIFVRRWELYSPTNPSETFDLFDRNGYYLWVVKFPRYPALLRDGCLYLIQQDQETGYSKFIRYRIKNWAALKQ